MLDVWSFPFGFEMPPLSHLKFPDVVGLYLAFENLFSQVQLPISWSGTWLL